MEIAILIPCLNEELTIEKVVKDFKTTLPNAIVYVYDNDSEDNTFEVAKNAGAVVVKEFERGKANVIHRMFSEIEADIYIMVDGDDTYPAESAPEMIELFLERKVDMVIGDRLSNDSYSKENTRAFHGFGNSLIKSLINNFFNANISDVLTGYRVMSKKLVKNYSSSIKGFELETDLTLYCLNYDLKILEFPIIYRDRPEGSVSKLNTISDGFKVITLFFNLYRLYKPLYFFGIIAALFFIIGIGLGMFPIYEYFYNDNHFITKVPTAILSVSLIIIAILLMCCGLILDNLSKNDKKIVKILMNK